jgi:hypothetical protein
VSTIPESLRRQWLPFCAALAVTLVASAAVLSLNHAASNSTDSAPASIAAPGVRQAPWHTDVSLEGRVGKLTNAQRKAFNAQRPRVVDVIENLYSGMFLEPSRLKDITDKTFTATAASSLRPSKLGFPAGTNGVQMLRRGTRIGIQATGARNAAAEVTVVARGHLDGKKVKMKHTSDLWLSRDKGTWKVIAFEVKQRPLK